MAIAEPVRIAAFHTELSRDGPGLFLRDVLKGDEQVGAVVSVIRAAAPDVLLLADIDYDLTGAALRALADVIGGYPYHFALRPNRGLHSGRDLDGNGRLGGPGDAEGYGDFAGQGGLAILSRYPIDTAAVRDFSGFAWIDLPGHSALEDGFDPSRLSTTAHWDVPLILPGNTRLHLLAWHATAPVFDGPEDRNGRRNHDEAMFWLAYLDGKLDVAPPENFVLLGVANADPFDGDGRSGAITSILSHEAVSDLRPESDGGVLAAREDGGVNATHAGPPAQDTVDWPDDIGGPGNLRVDYVLPAARLGVKNSGILWPLPDTSLGRDVRLASRHRLVWIDVEMPQR